jgi:hypothetical protein
MDHERGSAPGSCARLRAAVVRLARETGHVPSTFARRTRPQAMDEDEDWYCRDAIWPVEDFEPGTPACQ